MGRIASHGCVRLAPENAVILFDLVQTAGMSNTRIILKGGFFDFGYQPKRSFADVGAGIDKVTKPGTRPACFLFCRAVKPKAKALAVKATKKPVVVTKKVVAVVKKPVVVKKKVVAVAAAVCVTKDGKKSCKKPAVTPTADAS